jgi:hypothetical protein
LIFRRQRSGGLRFEASLGKELIDPFSKNKQTNKQTKNPPQKRADGVAQGIGLKFKPQYHKENKASNISCFRGLLFNIPNILLNKN